MAEGDALRVREALTHLTTQYQSQQIDKAGFHRGIGALKDNYVPLGPQITGYQECYDYYEEEDPCLEVVQLGKSHLTPSQPLTDKEIFFRGMYPHIKSPEEKKAFRELIQFSDEHKIPYTEYFKLLRSAFQKFSIEDKGSFEENMKQFHFQKFLLQSILYAAMYALNKAPPLSPEQLARMPEGLKLYYQGYEETVLGHLMRWEIMPDPGDPQKLLEGDVFAVATYFPDRDQIVTSRYWPFLSLFNPYELAAIYHELFHAYQDSKKIEMIRLHAEIHSYLIGDISVLRIEASRNQNKKRSFETIKEKTSQTVKEIKQIAQMDLASPPDFSTFVLDKEKQMKQYEYLWDWAYAIIHGTNDDSNLKEKTGYIQQVQIESNAINVYGFLGQLMKPHAIATLRSTDPIDSFDSIIRDNEVVLKEKVCDVVGINPIAPDKHEQIRQKFKTISSEFVKDDLKFNEKMVRYTAAYNAFEVYIGVMAMNHLCLMGKLKFYQSNGATEEAQLLIEELRRYRKDIVDPFIYEVIGILALVGYDGVG